MNKQEAIERIESSSFDIDDTDLVVGLTYTKSVINQINEPEKVVVPKFVAEWIEESKKCHNNLSWVWFANPACDELNEWLKNHTETFMRAWLDGCTIEQEKLYTAILKISGEYLRIDSNGNFDHFRIGKKYILDGARGYRFTEDDLVKYHILGNDNYEVEEVEE